MYKACLIVLLQVVGYRSDTVTSPGKLYSAVFALLLPYNRDYRRDTGCRR
jgi:hypothetical protein